jgi:hypothetical protein
VTLGDTLPGTPVSAVKSSPLSKWHGAAARLAANKSFESDKVNGSNSKHLRMFTPETDGLAQVAIALIHRLERDATQVPTSHPLRKKVPTFRTASFIVFRLERFRDTPYLKSPTSTKYVDTDTGERRHGWSSARTSAKEMYRGEWMHRPIGGNEITLLVKILVPISVFLNKRLGLNGVATDEDANKRRIAYSDVRSAVTESWARARRAPRRDNLVLDYFLSIVAVLEAVTVGLCRRKGLTVNLRPFSEYQMLALVWCAYVALWFTRVVWFVITMDLDDDY